MAAFFVRRPIVTIVIATIVGLSLWYLSRSEPLLVQGRLTAPGSTSRLGERAARVARCSP